MSGAVFVRTLQLQHNLAGAITFEPFVGDGWPGDIAAELLEFCTLIGAPAHRRVEAKAVRVVVHGLSLTPERVSDVHRYHWRKAKIPDLESFIFSRH